MLRWLGYCEVALPVPLRTTFTYRVPDALDELVVPGARVVVPFRNRAMIGVVLEARPRAPAGGDADSRMLPRSWILCRRCHTACSNSDAG